METIDLYWDDQNFDIQLDPYQLEPVTIEDTDTLRQSIEITVRSSEHTRHLINSDGHPRFLLRRLKEEIEQEHHAILIGSTQIHYDPQSKTLLIQSSGNQPNTNDFTLYLDLLK